MESHIVNRFSVTNFYFSWITAFSIFQSFRFKIDCNIFYQFNRIQLSCRLLIQMCNCKRKVMQIRCCGFWFIGLSLLYNSLSEERLQYKPFVKGLYVT